MAKEVYMPALGMNQETGTLLRWLKAEGEAVRKGEPLMEVATDKTDVEIEAPASGVLRNVTAQEGQDVPVGQVMAWIAGPDEALAPPADRAVAPADVARARPGARPASPLAARVAAEHGVDLQQVQARGSRIHKDDVLAYLAGEAAQGEGRVTASPKARRLAAETGLDLAQVRGSGPEGAVLAADVLAAGALRDAQMPVAASVAAPAGARAEVHTEAQTEAPMSRMWKVMAQRLTESWTTVPHFFLAREVDASAFIRWHATAETRIETKLTYTDLLVKAVAAALRAHPRVNASWLDNRIVTHAQVHVGLAVAVEEGLLVPVIRDADRLGLAEIAAARAELVRRAQQGHLTVDELQGGTFTISNLGMYAVDQFSAIINPPQAAILAVGRVADRVVALDGQPAVRPVMGLNLSCDHRVVDGARAARFLDDLAGYLQDPLRMLD